MSGSSSNSGGSNKSIDLNVIKDYISVDLPIEHVELIKRFTDNKVFLHWGLLFKVNGRMIIFEYCDDGIHYKINDTWKAIYQEFMARKYGRLVYFREMKNFRRVTLTDIIQRVKSLESGKYQASKYNALANNCQHFVRDLAFAYDDAIEAPVFTVFNSLISADIHAYALDVNSAKINALIGMESYELYPESEGFEFKREDRHGKLQALLVNQDEADGKVRVGVGAELGKNGVGAGVEYGVMAKKELNENVTVHAGIQLDTGARITKDEVGLEVLGFGFSVGKNGLGLKLPFFGINFK